MNRSLTNKIKEGRIKEYRCNVLSHLKPFFCLVEHIEKIALSHCLLFDHLSLLINFLPDFFKKKNNNNIVVEFLLDILTLKWKFFYCSLNPSDLTYRLNPDEERYLAWYKICKPLIFIKFTSFPTPLPFNNHRWLQLLAYRIEMVLLSQFDLSFHPMFR